VGISAAARARKRWFGRWVIWPMLHHVSVIRCNNGGAGS